MISIKKRFLDSVGGIAVERPSVAPNGRSIKRSFERITLGQEANGVLHTTEGHWDPSANVFTETGTPTFMIGYEKLKAVGSNAAASSSTRIRVAQFLPIGEMALTLKNATGGTETNREALVQIELIGFSKFEKWSPPEPVMDVLADLVRQLHDACGIPLQRAGDGTRSRALWDGGSGWFGHSEVPENDHTDPRAFDWPKLFRKAGKTAERWEIVSGRQLLFQTPVRARDGETGLDRVGQWIQEHERRVQQEERENGRITVRRVAIPA
jgi:hypothetical protein